jgi:hypothetical protein
MRYIREIIAVELMKLSQWQNPLWFVIFDDIRLLTARH